MTSKILDGTFLDNRLFLKQIFSLGKILDFNK